MLMLNNICLLIIKLMFFIAMDNNYFYVIDNIAKILQYMPLGAVFLASFL